MNTPEQPHPELNPEDERRKMEEDASIGFICTVVATPLAVLLVENTVSVIHEAEKYGWKLEGTGVIGNGVLALGVTALAAYQWHKFHKLRDKLRINT